MKQLFVFLFALHIFFTAQAQTNTFNKHIIYNLDFGSSDYQTIVQMRDKGYTICRGATDSLDSYFDLIKLDKAGNTVWSKRLSKNFSGNSHNSIIKTTDGGLMAATSVDDNEIALIKTDSNGILLWSSKYPSKEGGTVNYVLQTSDLGYLVCGSTDTAGNKLAHIFKTDAAGNFLWGKDFIVNGNDRAEFNSITEIPGQGYVTAGSSYLSTSWGYGQGMIVDLDLNGNMIWNKNLHDPDILLNSVVLSSGNTLVFAANIDDGFNGFLAIVKTDLSGNVLQVKKLASTTGIYHGSYGSSVKEKYNGDFCFSAYISDPIPTEALFVTDSSLNVKWCRQYYYTYHTFNYTPSCFEITTDSGFVYSLLGGTLTGPGASSDFSTIIVKTDSMGIVGCDGNAYPLVLHDTTCAVSSNTLMSSGGNMLPYPAVFYSRMLKDTMWCANILDLPDTVSGIKTYEPNEFNVTLYPNPFTDKFTIAYQLSTPASNVFLEVINAQGIRCYYERKSSAASNNAFDIETQALPAGIYFYSLTIDGRRRTGKMIRQ